MTPQNTTLPTEPDRLLELCRELRILDDAAIGAREELDEIADLVVRAHPNGDLEFLPETLRERLLAATSTIDDLDDRREEVRSELVAAFDGASIHAQRTRSGML